MKSLTAICQTGTGATMPAINASGRITRHPQHRGDGENAEMKMYLSKLKDLVPFMPKNRKLSKLEIIQHVIDYICDLQTELETHPDVNNFDAASALNNYANAAAAAAAVAEAQHDNEQNSSPLNAILSQRLLAEQEQHHNQQHQQHNSSPTTPARQPLVDRQTPNTILPNPPALASTTVTITTSTQLSTLNNVAAISTPTVTSSTQQQSQTASAISLATTEKESNSRLSQVLSSSSVSSSSSLSPSTSTLY